MCETLGEIKVRNDDIHTKIGMAPSKRIYEIIVYDNLVICNINLQMHQLDKKSLSIYDKLKE